MNVFISNPLPITQQQLTEAYQNGYDQYPIDHPPVTNEYEFHFFNYTSYPVTIRVYDENDVLLNSTDVPHHVLGVDVTSHYILKPSMYAGAHHLKIGGASVASGKSLWCSQFFAYGGQTGFLYFPSAVGVEGVNGPAEWVAGYIYNIVYLEI